jgi:hypothetical protein
MTTDKLPPEVKRRWVTALRSGEYLQGREALRKIDNDTLEPVYCCLGVLCQLEGIEPESWLQSWLPPELSTKYPVLGVPDPDSVPSGNNTWQQRLAMLNDDDELTFEEIADVIEAEL